MRFTNSTNLTQVLKYSSQRLSRILTVPITNGWRRLRRVLNPNGFTTRVMGDVRKGTRELLSGKPQSLKDYFAVGNYYIAKKMVYIALLLTLVVPIFYLKFLHPTVQSQFLTARIPVNSAQMMGYTGKVTLLSEDKRTVLFQGRLSEGRISGEGKLYDYDGSLVYQGELLLEQYEGHGQTFWPNGSVWYVGGFSANRYEGRGALYDQGGALVYEGDFSKGLYHGQGDLYQSGELLYRGGFEKGLYHGEGTLYQSGRVLCQGQFAAGQLEGPGRLYSGTRLIYDGGFSAGAFSGGGKEYDPVTGMLVYDGSYESGKYQGEGRRFDAGSGLLRYEGGFYQGVYEGSGKLYDPETNLPVYEGGFRAGRYDGQGKLYDAALGALQYEGGFLMGAYHGAGKEYDPATGFVAAAGEYRNGVPVTLGADGLSAGQPYDPLAPDNPLAPDGGGAQPGTIPQPSGPEQGGRIYHGPVTPSGEVDYAALAGMGAAQLQSQFHTAPDAWNLAGGKVLVYTDQTERLGLSVRLDGGGTLVGLDVWNDGAVAGARVGMDSAALGEALGAPTQTRKEAMGEGRMISISQSNRHFGRLTNLSPDSQVTIRTYDTQQGTVQAVFAQPSGECLLLEVLP